MLSNEKSGIIMIIASLLVMGLTVMILFDYQRDSREKLAREQGLGLARLMSSMPWEQVVSQPGRKGLLDAFRQGQNNPDFAYGVIVDSNGMVKSEVTSPGIITPSTPVPQEPTSWLGQRVVKATINDSAFIESHAPIFSNGNLMGFVRLGYIKPEVNWDFQQMPFIATLTLPIFLLTPLFYFILRREIRPLKKISQRIEKFTEGHLAPSMELQPSAELGQFMDRFNHFIEITQARIQQLNSEQSDLMMSGKLLSYKNNRVESILQTLPEAIMVIDEGGVVSYANAKLDSLLGIKPETIINKKPHDWCKTPEIATILSGKYTKGSVNIVNAPELTSQHGLPNKKLEIRTYPLFSPMDDSKLLGRMVVIRDVTAQFYEQQRQGEFVSQIAHELKTPLNVLSMYSESLLDSDLTSDEHRVEAANVIHDEVGRLANLIQNLLSITQYELGGLSIDRQRVRIRDFLEDTFNSLSKSDRAKNLQFELDLPREMSAVYLDKALFSVAINNLLTNAIKYNRPGGLVTLSAEEDHQHIEIHVTDQGFGISAEDQKHIFDKFFRSDDSHIRQQSGHGLGLSLSQQIVRIHHGEISVESTVGEGSRFTIRLDKESLPSSGNYTA